MGDFNETQFLGKKERAKAQQQAEFKRKLITWLIVVLVAVFAVLVVIYQSGILFRSATALDVNGTKYSAADVSYYYQNALTSAYNQLYSQYSDVANYILDPKKDLDKQTYTSGDMSWADYLEGVAIENIKQVTAYYDAAQADGFQLTDDQAAEVQASLDSLSSVAKQNGVTVNGYLAAVYGKGMNLTVYRRNVEHAYIAQAYADNFIASLTYTDEQLKECYQANKDDFDAFTYRLFAIAATKDDTTQAVTDESMAAAKAQAEAMLESVTEENFAELARQYAPEDSASSYEKDSATLRRSVQLSSLGEDTPYVDWLKNASRKAGDKEMFETDTGYFVALFVSRDDNRYNTVNVRHVLIAPETDDDAGWNAAKTKADELYSTWKSGEATEETFATLANENSSDGDGTNGGLYSDVYKGAMVAEFEDWCFDASRKPGDTGIVKTDYGYHIMYFVGVGSDYQTLLVKNKLQSDDYSAWNTAKTEGYTAVTHGFGMKLMHH